MEYGNAYYKTNCKYQYTLQIVSTGQMNTKVRFENRRNKQ